MASAPQPAMDKALLKRLLGQSGEKPVNCAFGTTKQGAQFLVDKIKNPKALEKELVKMFPDIFNTQFGQATVPESEPDLVRVVVNRAMSGAARRLAKSLKGTGYKRVEIMLEDGTLCEGAADDEDEEAVAAAAGGGAEEAAAARQKLGGMLKRLTAATLSPEEKAKLAAVAKSSMGALASGDVAGAMAMAAPLEESLDRQEASQEVANSIPAGTAVLGKAKLAWRATRAKVDGEVDGLKTAVEAVYKQRGLADVVLPAFQTRVRLVLEMLDDGLADDLDAVGNAKDEPDRQRLVEVVKKKLKHCEAALSGADIAALDANPFKGLNIKKTMSTTLAGIAAAIR